MENGLDSTIPVSRPSHYGCNQEELFSSKLGLVEGYVAVAPFGGGKSDIWHGGGISPNISTNTTFIVLTSNP